MSSHRNDINRRAFLEHAASLGAAASGALLGLGRLDAALAAIGTPAAVSLRQPTPLFNFLVIGDSIMWGQGLAEEHKFTTLVTKWIQSQLPGVRVQMHRYAHSGAVIRPDDEVDDDKITPGEIPNAHPSITAQLVKATGELGASVGRENVHLVLMDGGINDLNITTILTTDFSVTDKNAWIRRLTNERCVGKMQKLVPLALTNFPNAKVVSASYFPIVSERSDLPSLTKFLQLHDLVADGLDPIIPALRESLSVQSGTFHDTYVAGVKRAVLNARPMQVIASGTASGRSVKQSGIAGSVDPRLPTPERAVRRTAFAEIPFRAENCYGGSETWLWRVGEADELLHVRKQQCTSLGPPYSVNPKCYGAAVGHPNVQGARAYAEAIVGQLRLFMPEWQKQFTAQPAAAPARLPRTIRQP